MRVVINKPLKQMGVSVIGDKYICTAQRIKQAAK